jgi:hypothetical protein
MYLIKDLFSPQKKLYAILTPIKIFQAYSVELSKYSKEEDNPGKYDKQINYKPQRKAYNIHYG